MRGRPRKYKTEKEYLIAKREKISIWKKNNRAKVLNQKKKYYYKNRERLLAQYKNDDTRKITQRNNYKKNIVKRREEQKEYYQKNRTESIKRTQKWHTNNPNYLKNYRQKNKKQLQKKATERLRKFRKTPKGKVFISIKRRLSKIFNKLKSKKKSYKFIELTGCSEEFLVKYLESKFKKGMSWKNHGYRGWHIDHIVPISKFNLLDEAQVLKANNYKNLQPLWAKENMFKSDKYF